MEHPYAARVVAVGLLTALLLQFPGFADDRDELRDALEAAELSFAASVANKDFDSFASHLDEKAIFAAGPVHDGKPAILEAWSNYFEPEAPTLEWHPETVVVQEGGRLGISMGPYIWTGQNSDGTETIRKGRFISIWERQEDGGWKIIFDTGCLPCPDCSSD